MTDSTTKRFPLDAIRADGWFTALLEGSPTMAQVAQILGPEPLALATIAGARILEIGAPRAGAAVVKFAAHEHAEPEKASLEEFTARMASACLEIEEGDPPLSEDPSPEVLHAAVGHRTLHVAPLYEIGLLALSEDERGRRVEIRIAETVQCVALDDLRALLRSRVEALAAVRSAPESLLPMSRFEDADAAHTSGDHQLVVGLLGPLVGPIASLSRRPDVRELGADERLEVGRGLRQLGLSLAALERHEEAEVVLRVAIQWSRDDAEAAATYAALGELLLDGSREGQAIALFRRAHTLGADEAIVLPPLALALAARERAVAALGIVRAAHGANVEHPRLDEAEHLALEKVGPSWRAFEAFMADGFGEPEPGTGGGSQD